MSEMNCRETRGCLPGYELETFYQPLRGVGGDYFDIIDVPEGRTLIAVADVSGKGMPAAFVAANIQALVRSRSITSTGAEPVSLATQINRHLCRYTPSDCFATAIFVVLSREAGDVTYVNAGHNPPILSSPGSATFLASTGMPLGLLSEAEFDSRTVTMLAGAKLLMFTDGLPDGIGGQMPEQRICDTLGRDADAKETMLALKALIDPKFNEDDVTILLLRRLDTSDAKKLAASSVDRVHTVNCPHKKMPADVTASKWQKSDGQWTSWTIVDCPLLLAGLIDCDMSCLSQLEEIRKTNGLP